ncbi:MAG: AAA family ATPase [Tissierellia bacterium]|nr:AAA family ATPase [Tissierellia bacterium]
MNIVGHDKERAMLGSMVDKDSISLCFTGKEGIGKKKVALEYIAKILGLSNTQPGEILAHPDVLFIEPENNRITIDKIRQILQFSSMKSYDGGKKIVLIDDAHRMNRESQNALLKILEEPSYQQLFILITSNFQELLSTVQSRLLVIEFQGLHREELCAIAGRELSDEMVALAEGSASLLERYSACSMEELHGFASSYIGRHKDVSFIKEEYALEDFLFYGRYTLKVLEGMLRIHAGGKSEIRDSRKFYVEKNISPQEMIGKIRALDRAMKEYSGSFNKKLLLAKMMIEGR